MTASLAGNNTTLYAGTGGLVNNLYSINPVGPTATLIGNGGQGGAGYGSFDFDDSGVLYASINLAGGAGTGSDYLVTVNTTTGAATIVGSFGTCSGVTIPAPVGGGTGSCTIEGMEGIAFDSAGTLWGIENVRGTAGAPGLYKINKATGTATFVTGITGGPIDGVVSAQFACNGTLYGGSSRQTDGGRLGTVNTTTGAWTFITPLQTGATWTGGPAYNSMGGLAAVPSNCPFNVNKVFNPSDPGSVTVSLSCTDGGVAAASDNTASQADDANFTVTGFTLGSNPTCTATETGVPAGYTINSCNATLSTGVCTITNNETTTTFTVNKAYASGGPGAVNVTVTCSSGTVVTPNGNASPGSPFVTVVKHFNLAGTTCSASEVVPGGYFISANTCNPVGGVPISDGTPASCTITNSLIPPPTPNPSAVGGLVDVVTQSGSGSGGVSSAWLALLVLAAAAVSTVAGGTFAYVRKRS